MFDLFGVGLGAVLGSQVARGAPRVGVSEWGEASAAHATASAGSGVRGRRGRDGTGAGPSEAASDQMGLDLGIAAVVETFAAGPVGGGIPVVAGFATGGGSESICEDMEHGVSFRLAAACLGIWANAGHDATQEKLVYVR